MSESQHTLAKESLIAKEEKKESKAIEVSRPARVLSPFEEMDRWYESFHPRGWMRPFCMDCPSWNELAGPFEGRMSKVDVIDHDDEEVVRAEVPGIEKTIWMYPFQTARS